MLNYQTVKQPVIKLPRTSIEIIFELIGVMAIFTMIFFLAKYYPGMPERIPIHFGVSGKPDGWGGKETLLINPFLGTLIYIGMWLLIKYPHIYGYTVNIYEEKARIKYLRERKFIGYIRNFMVILITYIEWKSIKAALGISPDFGPWFKVVILLFITLPTIYCVLKARKL